MESIDWISEDTKDTLIAYFLLEAMSHKGIREFGDFDSSNIQVEMSVNGVSVSFKHVMSLIQKQLDDMGKEERKRGYDKAIQDVLRNVDGLSDVGID